MKLTIYVGAIAALLCYSTGLRAQAVIDPTSDQGAVPQGAAAPAPATPIAPTPGGERRAIRREDRRIDRNDPTGTLAPVMNQNGTVTAAPNGAAVVNPGVAQPQFAAPGVAAGASVAAGAPVAGVAGNYAAPNSAPPVAAEQWRYRNQNGQWLYYAPSNNWMVWNGTSWQAYAPAAALAVPVAPAPRVYSYPANTAPTQTYYNGPYRRGLFGRRYAY
jgi:hypothetical protein